MTTHTYTSVPYSEIDVHVGELNDDFIRILRVHSRPDGAVGESEDRDKGLYVEFPSCTLKKSCVLNDKTKKLQLQFDMEDVEFLQFLRMLKDRVIKRLVENWEEVFGDGEDISDEAEKYETIRETFDDCFTLRRNRSLVQVPVQCNLHSKGKFRDNYRLQIVNGRGESLPYSDDEVSETTTFIPIICVRGVRINHEELEKTEATEEDDVVISSMQLEFFLHRIRMEDLPSKSPPQSSLDDGREQDVQDQQDPEPISGEKNTANDPTAELGASECVEEDIIENEVESIGDGEVDIDDADVADIFQINPSRNVFEEYINQFRRTLNKKRVEYLNNWMRSRNITNGGRLLEIDDLREEGEESECEGEGA